MSLWLSIPLAIVLLIIFFNLLGNALAGFNYFLLFRNSEQEKYQSLSRNSLGNGIIFTLLSIAYCFCIPMLLKKLF